MSLQHKGLVLVLDGLGDRPSPQLAGKTPLEAAHTPVLNRMVNAGLCGLVDPLIPGMPVDTHTGTGVLLGLAPRDTMALPRGPVEAAGSGLAIGPGDVAIRCNFATLRRQGERLEIIDRRAGRIREDTDQLSAALQDVALGDGITATLHPATQHRAVLRLSGPGLSDAISDTDPGEGADAEVVLASHPMEADEAAIRTAAALNRFVQEAYARLYDHPVNRRRQAAGLMPASGIITRGAGMVRNVRNLIHHLGLRAALVAGESTVLGLGRLFNYSLITSEHFTALTDTDLAAKVTATREALQTHDLVFLHIKGPDICAHDRDPQGKQAFLERIDQALSSLLEEPLVIGVSGDHSTDSNTGRHSGDPVPSLVYAPHSRRDACRHFGEDECMRGGLGRISATSFLLTVLDTMGCLQNFKPGDELFLP